MTLRYLLGFSALWLSLLPDGALGKDPIPLGVSLTPIDRPLQAPSPPRPTAEQVDTLNAALAAVEALELERGPYAEGLSERLLEAATAAEMLGNVEQAMDLYDWALHNTRLNTGLYAEGQVAILEKLMALLRAQGDANAVGRRADYFFRVMGSGQPPFTEERVSAAVRWLALKTDLLLGMKVGEKSARELLGLHDRALELTEVLCGSPEPLAGGCRRATERYLALLYVIDHRIEPFIEPISTASRTTRTNVSRDWETPPSQRRLQALERGIYSQGIRQMDQAEAVSRDDPALLLLRGDWAWYHGRRETALDLYRQLLPEHADWFAAPVPLPEGLLSRDTRLVQKAASLQLRASVNARGRVSEIETLPLGSEDASLLGYARRQGRDLIFRPVLDAAGKPQAGEFDAELQALK